MITESLPQPATRPSVLSRTTVAVGPAAGAARAGEGDGGAGQGCRAARAALDSQLGEVGEQGGGALHDPARDLFVAGPGGVLHEHGIEVGRRDRGSQADRVVVAAPDLGDLGPLGGDGGHRRRVHTAGPLRELKHRGTLASVARALSYSPSSIPQQLSQLETEVGVELLEPLGRRVRLTPQAEIRIAHTEAVLERLERAEADIAASLTGLTGTLRIASFQTALALVPAALTLLRDSSARTRFAWPCRPRRGRPTPLEPTSARRCGRSPTTRGAPTVALRPLLAGHSTRTVVTVVRRGRGQHPAIRGCRRGRRPRACVDPDRLPQ